MYRSLKDIIGYKLTTDEEVVGKCKDALFDDEKWTIRYLDIDTGTWLSERRVLVSPISLGEPDWKTHTIPTILTKEQIENSPKLDSKSPVSKQWEDRYYSYFGWPHYALGAYTWGYSVYPNDLLRDIGEDLPDSKSYDAHLRSAKEVFGYKIQAEDNDSFGSVKDLIFDSETWLCRYFVLDTGYWSFGKQNVLISSDWISDIDWVESKIKLDLKKEQIINAPIYDASAPINREFETRLYDYHGKPKYWENDAITNVV